MSFDPLTTISNAACRTAALSSATPGSTVRWNNANSFNAEFQNLITRFAWNEIWGRPGLPSTRPGAPSSWRSPSRWALGRIRAARARGAAGRRGSRLTPDELKEVLMQSAIYAGVPAANTGFAHALAILREVGPQIGYALEPAAPGAAASRRRPRRPHRQQPALHYTRARTAQRQGAAPHRGAEPCPGLRPEHVGWLGQPAGGRLPRDRLRPPRPRQLGRARGACTAWPTWPTMPLRLLRELDTGPVVWVGLSMGGMVGQELACAIRRWCARWCWQHHVGYPEVAREVWQQRIATVREQGIEAIADAVMARYFHDGFRAEKAATVARFRRAWSPPTRRATSAAAMRWARSTRRRGWAPSRAGAGDRRRAGPGHAGGMAETLAEGIPGARAGRAADASHLARGRAAGAVRGGRRRLHRRLVDAPPSRPALYARVAHLVDLVELDVVEAAGGGFSLADVHGLHDVAGLRIDRHRAAHAGPGHALHRGDQLVAIAVALGLGFSAWYSRCMPS
jgi:3-oxoadipate enol-lactonase